MGEGGEIPGLPRYFYMKVGRNPKINIERELRVGRWVYSQAISKEVALGTHKSPHTTVGGDVFATLPNSEDIF